MPAGSGFPLPMVGWKNNGWQGPSIHFKQVTPCVEFGGGGPGLPQRVHLRHSTKGGGLATQDQRVAGALTVARVGTTAGSIQLESNFMGVRTRFQKRHPWATQYIQSTTIALSEHEVFSWRVKEIPDCNTSWQAIAPIDTNIWLAMLVLPLKNS